MPIPFSKLTEKPKDMTPRGQVNSWTPKSTTIPSSAAIAQVVKSPTALDKALAAVPSPNKKDPAQRALVHEFDVVNAEKKGGRKRKSRKTKRKSKSRRTRRRS